MKYARLALVLALMALGTPLWAGSGDTPGDPQMFTGRNIYFDFVEFTSTPPNAITYKVWQSTGTADSTLVATLEHVGDGRTYSVPAVIAGEPGTLNRLRVWGLDMASGLTDYCTKWVMQEEHHSGGCACRAR